MPGDSETYNQNNQKGGSEQVSEGISGPIGSQNIDAKDAKGTHNRRQEQEHMAKDSRWPRLRHEWIMVAFTGVLAATTFFQWLATREAIDISREALISVQRAFIRFEGISVSSARIRTPAGMREEFRFSVDWINSGSTPATGVVSMFTISELPSEPAGEIFRWGPEKQRHATPPVGVIGPGGYHHSGPVAKPKVFFLGESKGSFTAFTDKKIFFWGWIVYRDVFSGSKIHVTEFCQQLTTITHTSDTYKIQLTGCEQHNCVDEYCEDYNEIVNFVSKGQQ